MPIIWIDRLSRSLGAAVSKAQLSFVFNLVLGTSKRDCSNDLMDDEVGYVQRRLVIQYRNGVIHVERFKLTIKC